MKAANVAGTVRAGTETPAPARGASEPGHPSRRPRDSRPRTRAAQPFRGPV